MNFKPLAWWHQQVQVTKVYGIPVRVDYRWFLVFALSVWLVAQNLHHGAGSLRAVSWVTAWILGIVTTLGLFLCIFGHELAHALMARFEGIETEEIVLHPFGGLARLQSLPESPRAEFRIASAGPAASFIFAALLCGAMLIAGAGGYELTAACFFLLFFGNLLIAIFNLFPGYPLDGGRVLRAYWWARTGDMDEATRKASRLGQFIAWAIVAFGLFLVARFWWNRSGDLFTGLWSILIGLFLRSAASRVMQEVSADANTTLAGKMSAPGSLAPETFISHFVDHILPAHRRTVFPVVQAGRLHGMLLLQDLQGLPRERWRAVRVREIMRPVTPEMFAVAQTPVRQAQDLVRRNKLGALAVLDNRGLVIGLWQPPPVTARRVQASGNGK